MAGALNGIKVLDLTRNVAGPQCTSILTDYGAEVLKVEHPKTGDDTRYYAPSKNMTSGQYAALNRGRKGLAINMGKPEGQEIIRKLAAQVDILVENYQPGTMKKWGLDYETLSKINPQLVYCSISGFGNFGPDSNQPGYDLVAQAQSGIMDVNGWTDGPPTRVGVLIGDQSTGIYAASAVLAALHHKEKTGEGQYIDISLQDVLLNYYDAQPYFQTGRKDKRTGNRLPTIAPFDTYPTKDEGRWVTINAANNTLFGKICELMGQDLLADERFKDNQSRVENVEALTKYISDWSRQYGLVELSKMLANAGIPSSPILTFEEVISSPHIKARNMVAEVEDPVLGKMKYVNTPVKMSKTPAGAQEPAPTLGQHTEEVLSKYLGLTKKDFDDLRAKEVIK